MFCTNCGATIPDNSAFCTNCGAKADVTPQAPVEQPMQPQAPVYEQPVQPQAPVYEQPVQPQAPVYEQPVQPQAPVYEQPVQPQAPVYGQPIQQAPYGQPMYQQAPYGQPMAAKPAKKKGVIALVAGIIVAIIVVVVLLIVFVFGGSSKNTSMEDPIDKVMKAVNEQKLSYLYESMPSFMAKDVKEDIKDSYENEKEFWEEEFGIGDMYSSMTMSYEIADKEKLDKDEIDELEEEIEYEFDKKVSISSAYVLELDVEATLKFNTKALKEEYGDDYAELLEYYYGEDWKKVIEESDTLEAVVIKINDEWFLYDPEAFF